jgi:EAL domain-containing protein (putative c-di-GMP-specific phosphodiesterase class I)
VTSLRIQLKAGDVLFNEGDEATTAFLIESGLLEVAITVNGWRTVLGRLRSGELIGEMAVVDSGPRTATAIAVEDCVLFPIDRAQISERLADTDPIIRSLLEGQVKRYRGAIEAIRGVRRERQGIAHTLVETSGVDSIRLEANLREALANDGLEVRYQPILAVAAGRIAGYEALLRWNHPNRGWVSPMEMVELAEKSDLIVKIGEYVFDTACAAIRGLLEAGASPGTFIAVNVSSRQLEHPGLIQRIVDRIQSADVPAGSLKVEITETRALDNNLVAAAIDLCHRHGIGIALDDFGTGFANLSQMHTLAFDTLKVDQTFSGNMLSDPRSMAIVEAIVRMGKALGAAIVVEGIESEQMLGVLRELKCDYAQGFLIGHPQPLDAVLAGVARQR